MKRIITMLLVLIMVLSAFVACSKDPAQSTPQATPNETPEETPPEDGGEEIDESKILNIKIDEIDYYNEVVSIYHWATGNPEFSVTEDATEGDAVNDAIYKRNLYTEQDLGITLEFVPENGHYGHEASFIDKLNMRIEDPNTPVDLVACYSRTAPHVLVEGLYVDLMTYSDTIDFSKAWWPENVQAEHEIKDRLFFVTGDISPGVVNLMEVVFLNKTRFASYGEDYEKFVNDVLDYKWTIDDFISLSTGRYEDIDGEAGETDGDVYGVWGGSGNFDGLYLGMGYRMFQISKEDDQVYELADDLTNGVTADYVTMMQDWAANPGVRLQSNDYLPHVKNFYDGLSLFMCVRTGYFDPAETEVDFIALPYPLKDENQKKYQTVCGNPYSLYGICKASKDKQRAAEVMQVMGYYGLELITPALFDVRLKGKFSKDDYAIQVFELMRDGIVFDAGRSYDLYTNTKIPSLIANTYEGTSPWTSLMSSAKKKLLNNAIKQINKKLILAHETAE